MQKFLMPFQGYKTYYCFFSKQYFSQTKNVICLGLREKFRFSLNVNRENKTKLTFRQKKVLSKLSCSHDKVVGFPGRMRTYKPDCLTYKPYVQ